MIRVCITEALRTLGGWVKRANHQNETLILLENGVARTTPNKRKICTGRDLALALSRAGISNSEASAWHRELIDARNTQKIPRDKWQ